MAAKPKAYRAQMGYAFRPQIELVVRPELEEDDTRTYASDFEMEPGEVVADAKDEMPTIVYVHRSDSEDPDEAMEGVEFKKIEWVFGEKGEAPFQATEDSGSSTPAVKNYRVKSQKILLYKADSASRVQAKIKAQVILPSATSGKKEPVTLEATLDVSPCYLFTQVWVVPGKERHHSEAGAVVLIHPNKGDTCAPLPGIGLEIKVDKVVPGAPDLAVLGGASKLTDDSGLCTWDLQYTSLTMASIAQGTFKVKCRLTDLDECSFFDLSVGQNVLKFLSAFQAAVPSLDLTNPDWQHSDTFLRNLSDWLWADFTLGLINNMRACAGGSEQYVCSMMTRRIMNWAIQRRFDLNPSGGTSLDMNGIEMSYYLYHPIHVFFGFQLSSQDAFNGVETVCIDPWWRQTVEDNVILTLDQEARFLKAVVAYVVAYAALIVMVFKVALVKFIPSSAALIARLTELCTKGLNWKSPTVLSGIIAAAWHYTFSLGICNEESSAFSWFTEDCKSYKHFNPDWLSVLAEGIDSSPPVMDKTTPW